MIQISAPTEFKSSDIPTDPGVYLYRDEAGEILYIGKAKHLRSRVKSYFSNTDKPAKTAQLVSQNHAASTGSSSTTKSRRYYWRTNSSSSTRPSTTLT